MQFVYTLGATLLAYLLGSLSFAVIVSRCMGLSDPRSYGSKNPGATNVLRSGSKAAAIITLVLDALKGFVPTFLVAQYGAPYGLGDGTVALVMLAAFAGHLWPVFFKFEGGKGVATALGALLGLSFPLGLIVTLVWILSTFFFRYSSLSSLIASIAAPLIYLFGSGTWWYSAFEPALALVIMSILLFWRHAGNIQRLMSGTESKLGQKKK